MAEAICLYNNQPAGYVVAGEPATEAKAYDFMPFRSPAHLRLAEAVRDDGHADVVVRWPAGEAPMRALAIGPHSITLAPKKPTPPQRGHFR